MFRLGAASLLARGSPKSVPTKKSRGFPSFAPVAALPIRRDPVCLMVLFDTHSPPNIPNEARKFAGYGGTDLVVMETAGPQTPKPMTKPHLGLPGGFNARAGLTFEAGLQRFPDAWGEAIVPGRFDQDASHVSIASFRERALMAGAPARMLPRHETEVAHEVLGVREAAQIAQFGHNRDAREEINAA